MKTIYFDMDGTIANFYGVIGWLDYLMKSDVKPYKEAEPMFDFKQFAKVLNALQDKGYKLGIITWLAKSGTPEYNEKVRATKRKWLAKHLPSVQFDEMHIVKYGTPKHLIARDRNGILFDDEEGNRNSWKGEAYEPVDIMRVLNDLT